MEALPFGQTASAVTPAAVPAAMPRSGGAAKRQGDVASLTLVAEVERARPELTIVIEFATDIISSICDE